MLLELFRWLILKKFKLLKYVKFSLFKISLVSPSCKSTTMKLGSMLQNHTIERFQWTTSTSADSVDQSSWRRYQRCQSGERPPTVTRPSLILVVDIFLEYDLGACCVEDVDYLPPNRLRTATLPMVIESDSALCHRQSTSRPSCDAWRTTRLLK